ncbi:MAG: hypothetical protein P8J50_14535 [Acidimicrobiales bacterium]|nr:hypothetical protein [Acidimicrobiales bacterium]
MGWLFDIVVAIIGSGIVVTAGIITAGTLWLRRRNQVVAGVKSPAPLGWLNSGRREARLHRRLRASGRRLELVPPTEDVAELVSRLQIELVEVDEYLVTVSRRPKQVRREDRKAVEERVEEIESLVRRIEERNRTELLSLDELGERLDLLEAADDELGPPE